MAKPKSPTPVLAAKHRDNRGAEAAQTAMAMAHVMEKLRG
jgi:hypothetical protein